MFDLERLIADSREHHSQPSAIRGLLERALEHPQRIIDRLGEPERGGIETLHHDRQLTILNVAWAPWMTLKPHTHEMWAVIGIYTGREDNIYWRRLPPEGERSLGLDQPGPEIEAAGAASLAAGDVVSLGKDIIHSVNNPLRRITGAIHIYGGDFFETERSEWNPESLSEQPYDIEANLRLFQEARQSPKPTKQPSDG